MDYLFILDQLNYKQPVRCLWVDFSWVSLGKLSTPIPFIVNFYCAKSPGTDIRNTDTNPKRFEWIEIKLFKQNKIKKGNLINVKTVSIFE